MNYRIYVEKKKIFNVESEELFNEIRNDMLITNIENVKVINIYDIFNIDEAVYLQTRDIVFSDKVSDIVYDKLESLECEGAQMFAVEYLPGQYDQRADSAKQCIDLLLENTDSNTNIEIRSGKLIVLYGKLTNQEIQKIKKYYINEVEMREKQLDKLETVNEVPSNETIDTIDEFEKLSAYQLQSLKNDMGLAMTTEDLKHIQAYYSKDEKRNPTETEIRVLDTYWSDHCRHTTFETILEEIQIEDGKYKKIFEENINEYLLSRKYVYGENAKDRSITLMDLATIAAKEQKRNGNLSDLEESDEINACSIYVDVNVNNKIEKWILQFKNETHNHPTEIEPFGGAATCIGGAIRDPLSGRTYVYQALRISGSANPNEKIEDTMKGKLPQKIITTKAAHGYSSYGNQIGLATTFVNEIYHSGYKAKRMELGVVVGAAPAENIRRDKPEKDDVVILLGGRTGRDGIGGATGSSKEHTEKSTEQCAAEVQKGNAITERKIQRLFRNKEVTRLIKKCNDFGAGGVSVAIGELADGLIIDLNKVPVKYIGLNGTELAISESQERMAVVIDKKDKDKFLEYADKENLEATEVAVITEEKRLVMIWNNNKIVDLSREFLDTNGAKSKINVTIDGYKNINNSSEFFERSDITADKLETKIEQNMATMNVASQRGLIEMFDSSIGSTTVLMPFGGKYQKTPSEVSIQKLPVMNGTTNTASIVAHGYNPNISSLSPYHGGLYAVIESMSKVVAAGGNYKNIRFTFQEYFERLGDDSKKWSKPLLALLGTNKVLKYFNLAAIGGKDSMSGTFNDISVPPTLVSFAVTTMSTEDVITTEFKSSGNNVYYIRCPKDELGLPNLDNVKAIFDYVSSNIKSKKIVSAFALKDGGIMEAICKMSMGNNIGVRIDGKKIEIEEELFERNYGSFVIETSEELEETNTIDIIHIAETIEEGIIKLIDKKRNPTIVEIDDLTEIWEGSLKDVFPIEYSEIKKEKIDKYYKEFKETEKIDIEKKIYINSNKVAKPKIIIPVFPGTNCEYDLRKAFENEGGIVSEAVFNNLSKSNIHNSIDSLANEIRNSQILMLPGGFSLGDEPDGSAKFIAAILRNTKISDSIDDLLKRDGLILGICNGFQALIKSGLLPYGKVTELQENSPTLSFNKIGKHMSKMVDTKIISSNSPWLSDMEVGDIHTIPISHGEGRVVISQEMYRDLLANGQIVTKYVDLNGNETMKIDYNPNGSEYAIEGLTSLDGKILGKMGHSERAGEGLYKNINGNTNQNIFKNGVKYFK